MSGALGRLVEHDPRSRGFAFAPPTPKPLKQTTWLRSGSAFDQGDLGSCFPAGTFIRMADGSERAIEDVRLGEYVATAEGRTGMVRQSMIRMETEGLIRLSLWGYSALRLTPEHPILTRFGYVRAGDLRLDDMIAMPRYRSEAVTATIETSLLVSKRERMIRAGRRQMGTIPGRVDTAVTVSTVPDTIELTPRFGRLVGLFLAEGSTDSGKVRWTFGSHEEETLVVETCDLLTDLGVAAHVQHRPNNSINVVVYGTAWARLWERLCGTGSGEKAPAAVLASGSPEFLAEVLRGWMMGDGHTRQRRTAVETVGTTVSKRLALAMFDIAQAAGLRPVLRPEKAKKNTAAKTRRDYFSVSLNEHKGEGNWRSQMDDKHVWRKVREIAHENFAGFVYNLSVEGDESYIAEGIGVHNCTGNAMAGVLNTAPFHLTGAKLKTEKDAVALYSAATVIDGFPGQWPPSDTGSSGLAVCKAAQQAGLIGGYLHAFSIDDALQALMHGPVITGVNWYSGFDEPDAKGLVKLSGYVRGGHEVEANRYDPKTGLVGFWNSWGKGWGLSGRFYMHRDTWARLLSEQGDVTIPVALG